MTSEKEERESYKIMVKVRTEDPCLPPFKHLDTLELPKGHVNPIETEIQLVSLLYLVYRREMKLVLQVSRGGFKTVYKAILEPVTRKTRKGKKLKFLKYRRFEEHLEYYLGIEPVNWKRKGYKKIDSPRQQVPPAFLKEKRKEFKDYQKSSRHRVRQKDFL